jgi:hypothetical protein
LAKSSWEGRRKLYEGKSDRHPDKTALRRAKRKGRVGKDLQEAKEREEKGLQGTRWSEETREKALAHVMKTGSLSSASRKFGVPTTTVSQWFEQMREEESLTGNARTVSRLRAIRLAWNVLERTLNRIRGRLEASEHGIVCSECGHTMIAPKALTGFDGKMSDAELIQAGERLARVIDNLGEIVHKMDLGIGPQEGRRAEDREIEEWLRANTVEAEATVVEDAQEPTAQRRISGT